MTFGRAGAWPENSTNSSPSTSLSKLKDAALRLGGLNWAGFFKAQPDTPAKLAAFAYAFELLEIGAYEQLRRLGDARAAAVAERILPDERRAAEKLHARFEPALDASLEAVLSGPRRSRRPRSRR